MKGQKMSENVITETEVPTEVSETVENVETVETDSPETVETEVSAEEKAQAAIDALDDTDPLKAMVGAFRSALTEKGAAITALVREIRAGGEEIDEQIAMLIEDSTDVEIVESRNRIAKMRAALDEQIASLNSKIASENDLTPMTPEVKAEKTEKVSDMRQKYNAVKSASEKALANMLPDGSDSKVFFVDLATPENVSGGTGTGKAKPRLKSVSVSFKGETTEILASPGNKFPTFGDVAEFVSEKSSLKSAGNRIKPTAISEVAIAHDLVGAGVADFEFTTSEGANVFKIHAVTRTSGE